LPVQINTSDPTHWFSALETPKSCIRPGERVEFVLTSAAYATLSADHLDDPNFSLRSLNALAGPVFVEGANPGDALGVTIEHINIDSNVYVPFIARWRSATFGIPTSTIQHWRVEGDSISMVPYGRLPVRPMIGCLGVAPAAGRISSLGPTAPTGGNMNLQEIATGSTTWLPVQVPGALVSLGDLHAAMGRGEALGAGLECGGTVTAALSVAKSVPLSGPRIETDSSIHFIGTDVDTESTAQRKAVRAAWDWLTVECGQETHAALAICAALLDVNFGGPAGHNIVASFQLPELLSAGVRPSLLKRNERRAGDKSRSLRT
jgi:amidase